MAFWFLNAGSQGDSIRGPLHGIPIFVKPRANAHVVDLLLKAGAIILGKTNLSNPGGSSSSSAVAVSTGYAPYALGTETDGSLICPAGRAVLYTTKPTVGLVSQKGVVPISGHFDLVGPMTKTMHDIAVLLNDTSVAVLDPKKWRFITNMIAPLPGAEEQMNREIWGAYMKIKAKALTHIDLPGRDALNLIKGNIKGIVILTDYKTDLNPYLEDLEESDVRSLENIIRFNIENALQEFPGHAPNQDRCMRALTQDLSPEDHAPCLDHLRHGSRMGLDVITGPLVAGFSMTTFSISGYPIAGMPLSCLDCNGRPFGATTMATREREDVLVKVMSA
ncbi:amidase signature domain-containing protein [Triangularia setosa]|uniref:Amidase signature domain-containing protein n=1 Tax=Triangularia setosa TaxID=2587417 RepID=A0AAN6VZF3_9PEZI|nr:amidase signature domain-containing protein [Podospora setosa]